MDLSYRKRFRLHLKQIRGILFLDRRRPVARQSEWAGRPSETPYPAAPWFQTMANSRTPAQQTQTESISRCQICYWPMATRIEDGCVPGSCAHRPAVGTSEGTEEAYRSRQRRKGLTPSGAPPWDLRHGKVEQCSHPAIPIEILSPVARSEAKLPERLHPIGQGGIPAASPLTPASGVGSSGRRAPFGIHPASAPIPQPQRTVKDAPLPGDFGAEFGLTVTEVGHPVESRSHALVR